MNLQTNRTKEKSKQPIEAKKTNKMTEKNVRKKQQQQNTDRTYTVWKLCVITANTMATESEK